MGQPKRKQSKSRSRDRRGANAFKLPQFAKDVDGGLIVPHRVNPRTGSYKDHQAIEVEL